MTSAIICGGRDYADYDRIAKVLDRAVDNLGLERIIQGGATGADALARRYCIERDMQMIEVQADWSKGDRAGPLRNMLMLAMKPDFVIAFPGGKGTAHMTGIAEKAGSRFIGLVRSVS